MTHEHDERKRDLQDDDLHPSITDREIVGVGKCLVDLHLKKRARVTASAIRHILLNKKRYRLQSGGKVRRQFAVEGRATATRSTNDGMRFDLAKEREPYRVGTSEILLADWPTGS